MLTVRQAFYSGLRWQMRLAVVVALVAFLLKSWPAAISVLLGAGAVMLGGYLAVMGACRKSPSEAGSVIVMLLKAEILKIAFTAFILLAVFKLYKGLVPFALIVGIACSALVSGAALRHVDK